MLDLGIYISAFQPLTNGDAEAIRHVADQSRHVLIIIGSSNRPRSVRAPFTLSERRQMIDRFVSAKCDPGRVTIKDLPDYPGDDASWGRHLVVLAQATHGDNFSASRRVGVACMQGRGALGAIMPSHWTWIDTHGAPVMSDPHLIRQNMLEGGRYYQSECPLSVTRLMDTFERTNWFKDLTADAAVIRDLKAKYGEGPFHAVDVIVRKGNRVLTIRRGNRPNKGVLAFPGGIIDPGETPLAAAQRELGEETSIGSLFGLPIGQPVPFDPVDSRKYDDPRRDPRYHMTTEAFLWELPDDGDYPVVTAHDDAGADNGSMPPRAEWIEISKLHPTIMWADHGFILRDLAPNI